MIDAAQQGKGYGRAALKCVLNEVQALPDGREMLVCYQANNSTARTLYRRVGFLEQTTEGTKITALWRAAELEAG